MSIIAHPVSQLILYPRELCGHPVGTAVSLGVQVQVQQYQVL